MRREASCSSKMSYIPTDTGFLLNINDFIEVLGWEPQRGDVVIMDGDLYTCGKCYGDMVEFLAEEID